MICKAMANRVIKRRLRQALSVVQVLLAGWIALWAGLLIYHLWIAGALRPQAAMPDTYHVVHHFGSLGISLYVSALLICTIAFAKWSLRTDR